MSSPGFTFATSSPGDDPANFLPDAWLADHTRHRWTIADRRADERESKSDL